MSLYAQEMIIRRKYYLAKYHKRFFRKILYKIKLWLINNKITREERKFYRECMKGED